MEILASLISLVLALGQPVVLEWLKDRPWVPFITRYTPVWNRITALVVTASNVVGVSYAFDATAGTFTVTGLDIDNIVRMAVTLAFAWIANQAVYAKAVKVPK